ncbi:MAG TPA: hypothetical protein VEP47_15975 [Reyranella sp.]|jgi:hypothetical protein|nr:hypothetical protein [Reyranella sp.]
MATTTVVTDEGLHGSPVQPHLPGHYLSWGAIIAGALCAAAISLVFFAFGSAIGLSAVSPWPHVGLSPTVALIIVALWTAIVQVVAFAAGGYVAGRVRNSWGVVVTHERRFRDGMHGLIVWAVGVLVGAAFAVSATGSLLRTGVQATATVAAGTVGGATAASAAGGQRAAAPAATPGDIAFDYLMRPVPVAAAAPAAGAPPPAANMPAQELKPSIVRIFADGLQAGTLPPADRTYLASLVAMRTGMSQADAEKRVDEAFQQAKDAEAKARAAADKARKASVLAAFLAAATLAIACAAACAGAAAGGRHRDEQTEVRLFGARLFW